MIGFAFLLVGAYMSKKQENKKKLFSPTFVHICCREFLLSTTQILYVFPYLFKLTSGWTHTCAQSHTTYPKCMLESLRHASSLEAWEGGDKYGDAQEDQVRDGNFDINALAPRCDRNVYYHSMFGVCLRWCTLARLAFILQPWAVSRRPFILTYLTRRPFILA